MIPIYVGQHLQMSFYDMYPYWTNKEITNLSLKIKISILKKKIKITNLSNGDDSLSLELLLLLFKRPFLSSALIRVLSSSETEG